jgi:serine/threonine protein kinase
MGTPSYMSPEQGKGDSLDGRSDLYSLGIIFYEMLTGQVPYQDKLPMMVVIKHIRDPLPSVRELAPELSEAIERVVIKSLAKEPDERYQTAEDFVQSVKNAIQVNPPSGRAVSKALDSVYDRLLMKSKSTQNEATSAKGTDDASPSSDGQTFISPRPSKDTS